MHHQSQPSAELLAALEGAAWRKATASQGDQAECVELTQALGVVAVRDSKHPKGGMLLFSPAAMSRLAKDIKRGEHHL